MPEDILNSIETIIAIAEAIAILSVAPDHWAGEISSKSLQRLSTMIVDLGKRITGILSNSPSAG
jgi:hypothetical protein